MKLILSFVVILLSAGAFAQDLNSKYQTKKVAVSDTILVDNVVSIPGGFLLQPLKANPLTVLFTQLIFLRPF